MNYFKGYYFKHQKDGHTFAFIPGRTKNHAFIQVITPWESRYFYYPDASFGKVIRIGNNSFSTKGIRISLPNITGCIKYGKLLPLQSDIMGIFRFLPMECRHVIISMKHTIYGNLNIDGKQYDLNGGCGYIEGDCGYSFPRQYTWIHANDFPGKCSMTLSIADIPFMKMHFQGAFAVIILNGKEYRFATYYGTKVFEKTNKIVFKQQKFTLIVRILSSGNGHPLASPEKGIMGQIIRESNDARINIRLYDNEKLLCNITSEHAGYEHFPTYK